MRGPKQIERSTPSPSLWEYGACFAYLVALEDSVYDVGVVRREVLGRLETLGFEHDHASHGLATVVEQRTGVPDAARGTQGLGGGASAARCRGIRRDR
jgi:hypothetical protein